MRYSYGMSMFVGSHLTDWPHLNSTEHVYNTGARHFETLPHLSQNIYLLKRTLTEKNVTLRAHPTARAL